MAERKTLNYAKAVATISIMTAILWISKYALSAIAGFEVFTFLLFVFAAVLGLRKTLTALTACILIDMAFWGIAPWVIMYLLHFPFVVVVGKFCVKLPKCAFHDLFIGLIMALLTIMFSFQTTLIEHWLYEYAFWPRFALGLPVFIVNTSTNFALGLLAYSPLVKVLRKTQPIETLQE